MCLRISKKQLAILFDFHSHKTGRHYTDRLRAQVFTDTVLEELEIDPDTYKKTRTFDAGTTKRILDYFQITKDDLHKNLF